MALSDEVLAASRLVTAASGPEAALQLRHFFAQFVGWPYLVTDGAIVDLSGRVTADFATVIHASAQSAPGAPIPVDNVACVIDVVEALDEAALSASYERIGAMKRLRRRTAPAIGSAITMNTGIGVVFAVSSAMSLESIAEAVFRLNGERHSCEWPDMVVVASTGVVSYAAQFPGEATSGDFVLPAEGTIGPHPPPMYVVTMMQPTGERSLQRLLGFVSAHLAIFSPGARLPDFHDVRKDVPRDSISSRGYWGSPNDQLIPVPRNIYNDRYLPRLPLRLDDRRGVTRATVQLLPWEGGGVIYLQGKVPLEALLVHLPGNLVRNAQVIRRSQDIQLSSALPITSDQFRQMLIRFQQRSDLVVRTGPAGQWVLQKYADEGTGTPFVARIMLGLMRLREAVFRTQADRETFDKQFEFVLSSLQSARSTASDITKLWNGHVERVRSGEIAKIEGPTIRLTESIDKQLRKDAESFLNASARALKQGLQALGKELGVDIGFLFKKQPAFEAGIASMAAVDPLLAAYLREVRGWSEPLLLARNDIEHAGWTLPRVGYSVVGDIIAVKEPVVGTIPVTEFVTQTIDRLITFVEEFTVHQMQQRMPAGVTVTEIERSDRSAEAPERFRLTVAPGGFPPWTLAYHKTSFDET